MKTLLQSLLTLCLLLFPMVLSAQNTSGDVKQRTAEKLLMEVPVKERLEDMPQEMNRLYSQNPFRIPASQNEKLLSAYDEAFASDSLWADTRSAFEEKYDPEMIDATMEWIETDNTQQVLEAEKEFYTLQGIRKQVVREYEMEQNPPTEKRRELIKKLIQNRGEAEFAVASGMIIFQGMLSTINELNGGQLFGPMQEQTISGNYKDQLQSQIDQDLMNQYLVMYYELDDQTLTDYASFFETETGNWWETSLSRSVHSAYKKAVGRLQNSVQN